MPPTLCCSQLSLLLSSLATSTSSSCFTPFLIPLLSFTRCSFSLLLVCDPSSLCFSSVCLLLFFVDSCAPFSLLYTFVPPSHCCRQLCLLLSVVDSCASYSVLRSSRRLPCCRQFCLLL